LSRIIRTDTSGKERILLQKGIVLALANLKEQRVIDETADDLLAYIALSLIAICETIENSVIAWEKRGYWIKADKYRREWAWTCKLGAELKQLIIVKDWEKIEKLITIIDQNFSNVKISRRNRLGKPWVGSYTKLISPNKSQ